MDILNEIVSQSSPVEELSLNERSLFKPKYFSKKKPVVLKSFAKDWGATKKWSLDFFINLKEDKDVYLLSGNFIQEDNRYKRETFKKYIQKLKEAEINNKTVTDYLTTLDIFNQYPELHKDVDFSIFNKLVQISDITAWVGPSGTISGFHADTGKNMYAQIKGRKRFVLSSTKFNKNMYQSDKYIAGAVASKVDINNYKKEKFPDFLNADFLSVILEPGDVLYIPQKWWHYVQSLDTSISISDFGYTKFEINAIRIIDFLHRKGFYKAKNCFCCNK